MSKSPALSLATVAIAAVATVVIADLAIQALLPKRPDRTQLNDGLAALAQGDPEIMVFGSSHTRSFHDLQADLRAKSGTDRVVIVTEESGWAISFDWVYRHRLIPLLDEAGADGARRHQHLTRALLVLTYTDLCGSSDHSNIPRYGWRLGDFLEDVWESGITEYSRTYLTTRMSHVIGWSLLFQRGYDALDQLEHRFRPQQDVAGARARMIANLQKTHFVDALDRCPEPDELKSLDRVVTGLQEHGLEVTLIMFPIMPALLPDPTGPVLTRYRAIVRGVAERTSARMLDWVLLPSMTDEDFEDDYDHLTPAGAAKLMTWAQANDLSFLAEPPAHHASGERAP